MDEKIMKAVNNLNATDERTRMIIQAELVKQLLEYCSIRPGASILIQVTHDDGQVASAQLGDLAQFVSDLYKALECFQSEIM